MPDGSTRFELDPPLDGRLLDALTDIWVDVSNAGGSVGFVPEVTRADVEPVADAAFALVRSGLSHLVVAYRPEPIGFGFIEHRPGPLFRHWATVKRLQVHPTLQGQGIGTEMLFACHRFAPQLGIEALHLTARGGTGTEAFYERHGYEIVARIPGVIRVAPDDTREEIYLIKNL